LRQAAILWGHRTKALIASVALAIGRRHQLVIPAGNFRAKIMRINEGLKNGGIEWGIGQKASGMSKKFWSMQKRRLDNTGLIRPVHGGA
jgi:hypothetical protein